MLPMDVPAKRQRHPLGHEQRSLTGAQSSPGARDRGHRWLMGLEDGSGIPHQAVAGAPPVTRDGGAFGYVAAEGPPPAGGSSNLRPRRRWGDRAPRAGGPPPPCVRGHREAARHLRQAGLRVAGHVITPRNLGCSRQVRARYVAVCRWPVISLSLTGKPVIF